MKRLASPAAAVLTALSLTACAHGIAEHAAPGALGGVGHLARISVIDRSAGRELPVYWKEGRAYVAGQPGNEYQVRVRNVAGEDLLAVVSVDGVNAVTGQTAQASQSGYVIASDQSMDVSGWRKSLRETAAFYFTSLPGSYAARTGRPDEVGVIGVALFKRKPPEPVAMEPWRPSPFSRQDSPGRSAAPSAPEGRLESRDSAAKRSLADGPLGTGHGRIERNAARWASFERASPSPVETIVIHYDSDRNLVAQGIVPPGIRPRHANPFPGFAPDPA